MDPLRRKLLHAAGLAGLAALLDPAGAAACWGRRRVARPRGCGCQPVTCFNNYAVACYPYLSATTIRTDVRYTPGTRDFYVQGPNLIGGSGYTLAITDVDNNPSVVLITSPAVITGPAGSNGLPFQLTFSYPGGHPPASGTGRLSFSLNYTSSGGKICNPILNYQAISYG